MAHLKLETQTGIIEFSKSECEDQVNNWDRYVDADNALKWIYCSLIINDNYSERKAKKETKELLASGSKNVIDVRY